MVSRRTFLTGSAGTIAAGRLAGPVQAAPKPTEDGLYHQPWFLQSLLELSDDLDAAVTQGKQFGIVWELRGCPFCRDMHVINFAIRDIVDYVKARFDILQLNIIGAREVIDFDGERLPEKQLAAKYGVQFTPTFQFFAGRPAELAERTPPDREVARAQGYLVPDDFLAMFRFVNERAYERETLADYLRSAKSAPRVR